MYYVNAVHLDAALFTSSLKLCCFCEIFQRTHLHNYTHYIKHYAHIKVPLSAHIHVVLCSRCTQADAASRDANIKQLEERCEQLEAQVRSTIFTG